MIIVTFILRSPTSSSSLINPFIKNKSSDQHCIRSWEGTKKRRILEILFPIALFLLLPRKAKVHTSITDHPNRNDSSSYHYGIVWRFKTLMRVQMLEFLWSQ
ncbi:MAG: hypothetical protein ACI8RD_006173 [Bacillariaceae sp.]|jgi:hypothetical protein